MSRLVGVATPDASVASDGPADSANRASIEKCVAKVTAVCSVSEDALRSAD